MGVGLRRLGYPAGGARRPGNIMVRAEAGAVAPFPVARGQTTGFLPLPWCPLQPSVLETVLLGVCESSEAPQFRRWFYSGPPAPAL